MARRNSSPLSPWQELEEQAYHAYREWPLFLKLRLRQLRQHLPASAFASLSSRREDVSTPEPMPDSVAEDIALLKEYGLFVPEHIPDG
ncbi:hypothetical protein QPK87_28905 [Kamptonema cortianum]|jgi:hypothetical protein|nr:hypothetical protein [Kamptonema cortianum]